MDTKQRAEIDHKIAVTKQAAWDSMIAKATAARAPAPSPFATTPTQIWAQVVRDTKPFQSLAKAATGGPTKGFGEVMLHLGGALVTPRWPSSMSRR